MFLAISHKNEIINYYHYCVPKWLDIINIILYNNKTKFQNDDKLAIRQNGHRKIISLRNSDNDLS